MGERPKIKIVLTSFDKILEILSWTAIVAIWYHTIIHFTKLPDIIPNHYNFAGQVDSYGSKYNILALPILATLLFIGMTILNKFPHLFNYPTPITSDNAFKLYTSATRLLRILKFMLVMIFGFIAFQSINIANGKTNSLGAWFLPLILGMIFIPILYFLIMASKTKSR
jgi:uncharacterized membrane protein